MRYLVCALTVITFSFTATVEARPKIDIPKVEKKNQICFAL